jgi:hypothetical protein
MQDRILQGLISIALLTLVEPTASRAHETEEPLGSGLVSLGEDLYMYH